MVEYLGWETTYTEIVDSVRLRPKSVEPPITVHTFFTFKVVLPEEIKNFYSYLPEGTIHILRKHFYSTKLNLNFKFFSKTGFFRQGTIQVLRHQRGGWVGSEYGNF